MTTATLTAIVAYELFVGQITVEEFIAPFSSLEAAIEQLMSERWWDTDEDGTPAPDNLAELIYEYCTK